MHSRLACMARRRSKVLSVLTLLLEVELARSGVKTQFSVHSYENNLISLTSTVTESIGAAIRDHLGTVLTLHICQVCNSSTDVSHYKSGVTSCARRVCAADF